MESVRCTRASANAILAILNEAIANSTALYDYRPRTPEMMETWFDAKERGGYPVIGAESDDGTLMGFASYGPFRAWPAYKYSVEHSVYVERRFRGRGVGTFLMTALVAFAVEQDYHVMIGGIDAANTPSVRLHKSLGFSHCATIRQVGFKFGRWLDLEFYQLLLQTPSRPTDG
jgi:phosphinothricin acetyltransferase